MKKLIEIINTKPDAEREAFYFKGIGLEPEAWVNYLYLKVTENSNESKPAFNKLWGLTYEPNFTHQTVAQYKMGLLYLNGVPGVVEVDWTEAKRYFEYANQKKHAEAKRKLEFINKKNKKPGTELSLSEDAFFNKNKFDDAASDQSSEQEKEKKIGPGT